MKECFTTEDTEDTEESGTAEKMRRKCLASSYPACV